MSKRYPGIKVSQKDLHWSDIYQHAEYSGCWLKENPDIKVGGTVGLYRVKGPHCNTNSSPHYTIDAARVEAESIYYQLVWDAICWAIPPQ